MSNENTPLPEKASPPKPAASKSTLEGTAAIPSDTAVDPNRPVGPGSPPEEWVGRKLGKYHIDSVLGQGGMGVVLKAFDSTLERTVAIKVLAEHLATDGVALTRFLSEAKAAAKINHPHVMSIYEICQDGATNYLSLEYVPGGSLQDLVDRHQCLPVFDATRAMIDGCRGVGAAHEAGLIHRDIKPANFMRAADGSIKVSDFGLAKATGESSKNLTKTGMVVGTPFFMSPEQCQAKPLDVRSDIYSLGATYYALLTGQHPYEATDNVPQLMYMHCHGPVPDPRKIKPELPEGCSQIIARAMAKDPAKRYQSADDMLLDLQVLFATLSGQTEPASSDESRSGLAASFKRLRRSPMTLAGLAAAMLFGALFVYFQPPRLADGPAGKAAALPAGKTIKVGVLHSMTGNMSASEDPVVDATMFAIEEVNRAGGVLGKQIKAIIADGRSDPKVFAQEAERLIVEEKVCTVFGCWTSACRKTVRPIFEANENLLIYPVQFEGIETSPNIFYLGAAPNQQILPAIEWAVNSLGRKRFFLVGSDYVFPHVANAIIRDQLQRLGGEIVGEEYLRMGSPNVEPIVDKIIQTKPDAILNTINGDSNIAFFRVLRNSGVKSTETPTISFSIGEQGLQSLNQTKLEGDYAAWTYFQSIATAENDVFVSRFREKHPRDSVTDPMETAYVGVKMWAAAINEAQSIEPKKISRSLLTQRFKGPGGDARIDPDTHYCYRTPRIAQIQADGQFKVVWAASEALKPEPYPNTRKAEAWQALLHDLYTGWGNSWTAPVENR